MTTLTRRMLLASGISPSRPYSRCPSLSAENKVVRIGIQKYGKLILLKSRGTLEKSLKGSGTRSAGLKFPAGPQLLEALNAGAVDFGNAGEAPPIFAQAASPELVYMANEPGRTSRRSHPRPKGQPRQNLADLKGKKVALNKGSNVHFLLVKALRKSRGRLFGNQAGFLTPRRCARRF